MDPNQVYEADASMEADGHETSGLRNVDGHDVEYRARTSSEGEGDRLSGTTEESPLLNHGVGSGREGHIGTWEGASDFIGLPWWKRPSVLWLLPPFFLYSLAFGGIAVPRLTLALKLICREYLSEKAAADPTFTFAPVLLGGDNPQCRIPEVQAMATKFMLYTTLIGGILSAIVSPKLGALSDRFGRKPILCFITCGGICAEIVVILAAKYPDTVHYTWLLLGAFLDGICGSFVAGMAMNHSYAADCTAPPKRAVAFGYFQASLFGGIALGPLIAGYIIKDTGNVTLIFLIALACHLIYLISIAFVVPESLSKSRQLAAREKHRIMEQSAVGTSQWLSTLRSANLLAPLKILYPTGPGSSPALRANLVLLSTVNTIIFGVSMSALTVVLYYSEYQFGWADFETNLFVSLTSSTRVAVLMIVLPLLNYLVRTRHKNRVRKQSGIDLIERNSGSDNLDLNIIRVGLLFELLGFTGYGLARSSPLFVMSGVFASIGGIASPTLQSALTKHVPQDRTGQLLGAVGLLHALARVVCPTIFSLIYANTVKSYPQLVFLLLAGLFGLGFIFSCFLKPHLYLEEQGIKPATDRDTNSETFGTERNADEEAAGM